jgi:predicted Ser/Thr protein kinase
MERADALWREVSAELGLTDAIMVGRSHSARRVYIKDGKVCKIQLKIPDSSNEGVAWHGSLTKEFGIAERCFGISQIPQALRYWETEKYEAATYTVCPGRRLSEMRPSLIIKLPILWQLSVILWHLSWRGIAHNDVRENNILVDRNGGTTSVYLIDFDRAVCVSRSGAFHRNFVRIKKGSGRSFHGSWFRLAVWQLSPSTGQILRRCKEYVRGCS